MTQQSEPRRIEPDWPALGPEMAEALKPFADAAEDFMLSPNTKIDDRASITEFFNAISVLDKWQALTVGDLRRARTILAKIGGKTG